MGNYCTAALKEKDEVSNRRCRYKGCDSYTSKRRHKYCNAHYKLQGQFVEMYHYLKTDYGVSLSVLSIVELEMRLKYAYLFQIPCDKGHMFRNLKLYKKVDKRSVLYRNSQFIKMYEKELVKFDKQNKRRDKSEDRPRDKSRDRSRDKSRDRPRGNSRR